jgi:hypothetical protein
MNRRAMRRPSGGSGCFLQSLENRRLFAVVTPRWSDAFVDSVGMNIKLAYTDTPYNNYTAVKNALLDAKIRHVRDELPSLLGVNDFRRTRLNDLNASGIKTTYILQPSLFNDTGGTDSAAITNALAPIASTIAAIEGFNEPDNFRPVWTSSGGTAYNASNWAAGARYAQETLWNTLNAAGSAYQNVPILGASIGGPFNGSTETLGNIGAWADHGNIHAYQGTGWPGEPMPGSVGTPLQRYIDKGLVNVPGKSQYDTEFGWHTGAGGRWGYWFPPTTLEGQQKYTIRTLLNNLDRGIVRSYPHVLVDQQDDRGDGSDSFNPSADPQSIYGYSEYNFGLMFWSNPTGGATRFPEKPAYTALKNLNNLLDDRAAGSFTPQSIDINFTNTDANTRTMVFQKSNGKYYVAIWQEQQSYRFINTGPEAGYAENIAVPTRNIGISVAGGLSQAAFYQPWVGTSPTSLATSGTTVIVGDNPIIVELTKAGSVPTSVAVDGVIQRFSNASTSINTTWPDTKVGDEGPNPESAYRAIYKFYLPARPAGQSVSSASIGLKYAGTFNSPSSNLDAVTFDSTSATSILAADFDSTSNQRTVATSLQSGGAGTKTISSAALRDAITAAYNAGRNYITLRLQLSGATTNGNGAADVFILNASETGNAADRPTISVNFTASSSATVSSDGTLFKNGAATPTVNTTFSDTKAGDEGNNTEYRSVIKFSLPSRPVGTTVTAASFGVDYLGAFNTPSSVAGLYAFDSTNNQVIANDFTNGNEVLISSDISSGGVNRKTVAVAALVNAVNRAYSQGQNHVALRIRQTSTPTNNSRADVHIYATNEFSDVNRRPTLSLTFGAPALTAFSPPTIFPTKTTRNRKLLDELH